MAQVRLTKPLRLICTKDGTKTICEVEDDNPRSVTECWRDDVEAYEYELEYAIKDRVETLKLTDAVLFRRVNENGEYANLEFFDESYQDPASRPYSSEIKELGFQDHPVLKT